MGAKDMISSYYLPILYFFLTLVSSVVYFLPSNIDIIAQQCKSVTASADLWLHNAIHKQACFLVHFPPCIVHSTLFVLTWLLKYLLKPAIEDHERHSGFETNVIKQQA